MKAIVHGDHSFLDLYVAVVSRNTQCVVFSFDGSLTASVSVTGRDPRVRAGAIDVVRFWHDLVRLYISSSSRNLFSVVEKKIEIHPEFFSGLSDYLHYCSTRYATKSG